jgi:hypothetical protein
MTDRPATGTGTGQPTVTNQQAFRESFMTVDQGPLNVTTAQGPPAIAKQSIPTDPLTALAAAGVSIWLDDLSRDRITSGSLATLVRDQHVVGVTTNPTIFAAAITGSNAYTAQMRHRGAAGTDRHRCAGRLRRAAAGV